MINFAPEAVNAIQGVYDDERLETLADRIEAVLAELAAGPPFSARVRMKRMQDPKLWYVRVTGNGERFCLLWENADDGTVDVRWAGPDL